MLQALQYTTFSFRPTCMEITPG